MKKTTTPMGTPLPPQHSFDNKECPITDLWPSETNVCDCPSPATEGEKCKKCSHGTCDGHCHNQECERFFPPLKSCWDKILPSPADTEGWEEDMARYPALKFEIDRLRMAGALDLIARIRSLIKSAEKKGYWEGIAVMDKETDRAIASALSQRENEILREAEKKKFGVQTKGWNYGGELVECISLSDLTAIIKGKREMK